MDFQCPGLTCLSLLKIPSQKYCPLLIFGHFCSTELPSFSWASQKGPLETWQRTVALYWRDGTVVLACPVCASSGLIIQHKKALDCMHAGLWVQSISILGLSFLFEWWVVLKLVPKTLNYGEGCWPWTILAALFCLFGIIFTLFWLKSVCVYFIIGVGSIFVPVSFQNIGRGFWDVIAFNLDLSTHRPTTTALLIF